MQPTRISSRHKGKRPRYAEPGVSGTDEEAIEVDDGDEEEPPQKLPKLSQQGTPAQSKRRKRQGFIHTCVMKVCLFCQIYRLLLMLGFSVVTRQLNIGR